MDILKTLQNLFKKPDYYNCKCKPVTKKAEKEMLAKLKHWGYCPVCAGYLVDKNGGIKNG